MRSGGCRGGSAHRPRDSKLCRCRLRTMRSPRLRTPLSESVRSSRRPGAPTSRPRCRCGALHGGMEELGGADKAGRQARTNPCRGGIALLLRVVSLSLSRVLHALPKVPHNSFGSGAERKLKVRSRPAVLRHSDAGKCGVVGMESVFHCDNGMLTFRWRGLLHGSVPTRTYKQRFKTTCMSSDRTCTFATAGEHMFVSSRAHCIFRKLMHSYLACLASYPKAVESCSTAPRSALACRMSARLQDVHRSACHLQQHLWRRSRSQARGTPDAVRVDPESVRRTRLRRRDVSAASESQCGIARPRVVTHVLALPHLVPVYTPHPLFGGRGSTCAPELPR